MKNLATTLLVSSLFFIAPVMAGGGHDHGHGHSHEPVDQATAETKADEVMASLVEREKIDKSWESIKASSVEKKVIKSRTEWVAIYDNDKIEDNSKQKIYVFLTLAGEYIAVNYTGD